MLGMVKNKGRERMMSNKMDGDQRNHDTLGTLKNQTEDGTFWRNTILLQESEPTSRHITTVCSWL